MKIIQSHEVTDVKEWLDSKNVKTTSVTKKQKSKVNKDPNNFKLSNVDTDKYRFDHVTILHSVNLDPNGHWVTDETQKYINSNRDCWATEDLKEDAWSFVGGKEREATKSASVFEEHNQDPTMKKGRVLDMVIRNVPEDNIVAVDLLVGTEKKHKGLTAAIDNGWYNAVSMGCVVDNCICTICGNSAKTSDDYCEHIRYLKPRTATTICSDGRIRPVAELCKNSHFYDSSWVHDPADSEALHQNVIISGDFSKKSLAKKDPKVIIPILQGLKKVASKTKKESNKDIYEANFYRLASLIDFMFENAILPDVIDHLDKVSSKIYDKILDNYEDLFIK